LRDVQELPAGADEISSVTAVMEAPLFLAAELPERDQS